MVRRHVEEASKLAEYEQTMPVQLELFQFFDVKRGYEDEVYSNTVEIYDSLPIFVVGRSPRNKDGMLKEPFREHTVTIRDKTYRLRQSPAVIQDRKGRVRNFYPSAREEIVQDCLIKLACERGRGLFLDGTAGVTFTLYELRKELVAVGHSYSLGEIREALEICAGTHLDIEVEGGGGGKAKWRSNVFLTLGLATPDSKGGTKEKGFVRFHDLVTQSILQRTYRRYNFLIGMSFAPESLARRIHKRLSHFYTQAGTDTKPYEIRLTRLSNDLGLKQRYARRGLHHSKTLISKAVDELVDKGVLAKGELTPEMSTERKNKIVDYKITLHPSTSFIHEMILSNSRSRKVREASLPSGATASSKLNQGAPYESGSGSTSGMTHVGTVLKNSGLPQPK